MYISRKKFWAHMSLLVVNIIFGINFPMVKAIMPIYIKPLAFVAIRIVGAAVLFWITSFCIPKEPVYKKDILYLFFCSFFGMMINQIFFHLGLNLTSPVNSSIIMSINPIFAFIFTALILKEKITFIKGSGLAIGFFSVMLLIFKDGIPNKQSSTFFGDISILVNAISWALYTVIIKKMLEKYHLITVMKWTFLFGCFTIIPVGYNDWSSMDWLSISLSAWMGIGFVVVFVTYVGYLLIAFGLRNLSPTIVSTYSYTQPVIAAYLATLLGQDHVDFKMIIPALLSFVSIYIVSQQKKSNIILVPK